MKIEISELSNCYMFRFKRPGECVPRHDFAGRENETPGGFYNSFPDVWLQVMADNQGKSWAENPMILTVKEKKL